MYRKLFGLIIALSFIFGGVLYTAPDNIISAKERSCNCYCTGSTSPKGVKKVKSQTTSSDCEKVCRAKNEVVAVCAYSPKDAPSNSVYCFTQEQCSKHFPNDHLLFTSTFGTEQPSDCPTGYHRCYSKRKPGAAEVNLNVSIGAVKSVKDLGEYLPAMYKWLLASGSIIAVVLIMIGGLQYALGGMSQDQVAKAKKRISNAVIGLVLMVSVVIILTIINPQLLKIEPPAMPLIKSIVLADGQSCEYLKETLNYQVLGDPKTRDGQPGQKKCGNYSEVKKDDKGQQVAEGITCAWEGCSNTGDQKWGPMKCLHGVSEDRCLRCGELWYENPVVAKAGLTISSSLCRKYTLGTSNLISTSGSNRGETTGSVTEECMWSKDGEVNKGYGFDKMTVEGACTWMTLVCGEDAQYAGYDGVEECEDYDDEVQVVNEIEGSVNLEKLDTTSESEMTCAGACADNSHPEICLEDPCNVGPCKYYAHTGITGWDSTGKKDCLDK